jgi:hypothetical protein
VINLIPNNNFQELLTKIEKITGKKPSMENGLNYVRARDFVYLGVYDVPLV